jgi:hypothetical protein
MGHHRQDSHNSGEDSQWMHLNTAMVVIEGSEFL